jgi:hypothetical protein
MYTAAVRGRGGEISCFVHTVHALLAFGFWLLEFGIIGIGSWQLGSMPGRTALLRRAAKRIKKNGLSAPTSPAIFVWIQRPKGFLKS